jgi:predicted nucleic acid-binding protein
MKKIVIDSNIFMDFLFKREGHEKAAEIFKQCIKGNVTAFSCAHEITTLSYFLSKSNRDKAKVRKTISGIIKRFKVIATDEAILAGALHSDMDDFEDAVIEVSAQENGAEYILTRNIKDFKKSVVRAITPEELLAILRNDVLKEDKNQ